MSQQYSQRSVCRQPLTAIEKSHPQPVQVHQYSCATCRSRKIKCNKTVTGCAACQKSSILCIYPARRTQQSQRARPSQSVRPLARAERRADDGNGIACNREELAGEVTGTSTAQSSNSSRDLANTPRPTVPENVGDDDDDEDTLVPREMRDSSYQSKFDIRQPSEGMLFVAHGKSRYITGSKASQIASVERIFSSMPNIASREGSLPKSANSPNEANEILTSSLLFIQPSTTPNLRAYHPAPEIIALLWDHYECNVDILIKILYKPTVEAMIVSSCKAMEEIDAPTEALLFGIYFAAVTTMSTEECLKIHGGERSVLLEKYGCALEHALTRAKLFTTQQVVVLQAMILLIGWSPRKNTRSTWMLTGTALRIAQAMGMHRDSESFSLGAVEVEVRRRVWWALCLIDNRISEDCGLDCNVPMSMNTKLPLHINDSDIGTSSLETLAPRLGFTEMTVSLIKLEMVATTLKLKRSQLNNPPLSIEEMETLVGEQQHRYESSYLPILDTSLHTHHVMYLGAQMAIAKLWKLVYDLLARNGSALQDDVEIKDRLIIRNTEIVEIMAQISGKSSKFRWYFCQHTKWHAVVYLFTALCNRYEGPAADRVWAALDALFGIMEDKNSDNPSSSEDETEQSVLWKPLQKLFQQARLSRKQVVQPQATELDHTPEGFSSLGTVSTPVDNTLGTYYEIISSADPFLGSVANISEEMNWEEWDTLLQKLQPGFLQQQDSIDYQEEGLVLPLSWC